MHSTPSLWKLVAAAAAFVAIAAAPASASCLSAVPNACADGNYDENAVVNYYTPIFQLMAENPVLNPEGPDLGNICIATCEQSFRQNIAACRALPTNDPTIGNQARDLCIQVAEQAYLNCLSGCMMN